MKASKNPLRRQQGAGAAANAPGPGIPGFGGALVHFSFF